MPHRQRSERNSITLDPRALKSADLCRLLNSTPLGTVATERLLRAHRMQAGFRIGDGKATDLVKYVGWLCEQLQIDRATPEHALPASIRASQAELMRRKRAGERDIAIPPPADLKRRGRCEADPVLWLSTYFPKIFTGTWTPTRRDMVAAILHAARYGGDQSLAAPRGEGKSKITECVVIFCIVTGLLRFPLIVAATGHDAARILGNIKMQFEFNDLLAADYPEVCVPVQSLAGAPQRAGMQTVAGVRTQMKWGETIVVFPTVAGSKASGAVLMTRGLDAAIRGVNYGELRPDLVIIDDPETRESVKSESQTTDRELAIETDLAGLGGPGKKLARLMLTTIQNRRCLSFKYTDPTQKPSWSGRRFRFIEQWPEHEDLWDQYMQLRAEDQRNGDKHARRAHAFYLEQRTKMDRGAKVSNPERFIGELVGAARGDGASVDDDLRQEVSALQHAFNIIADRGREHFDTEYQNDPQDDETLPEGSGISLNLVMSRLNGYEQGFVPEGTIALTVGIDVGKYRLHWVVVAWLADGTGRVVDYGVHDTGALKQDEDQALDRILYSALLDWREQMLAAPYYGPKGEVVPIHRGLIDRRFRDEAVYRFIRDTGGAQFLPAVGIGDSADGRRSPFREKPPEGIKLPRKPGDRWYAEKQLNGIWLVSMDTDYWKQWVHDRWLTPVGRPGSLSLWGNHPWTHKTFARHQTAEEVRDVWDAKKGHQRKFVRLHKSNHWLDAMYMAAVAASQCGITLFAAPTQPDKTSTRRPRVVHRVTRPGGGSFVSTR